MARPRLNPKRLALLASACWIDRLRNVMVVRPHGMPGWEGISQRRNIEWLTANGYLEANAYGDHYLTELGRAQLPEDWQPEDRAR